MEKERKKLNTVDTLDIIDYIKQSVEILMHMRQEEFDMFKQNWEAQEKIKKSQIKEEKEKLKQAMMGNEKEATKSKLFEKVKFDLLSEQSSVASLTTQPKLDK